MGAPGSPGKRIVVPRNNWDNFSWSLEGKVGLQERFGNSRLDSNREGK